MRVLIGILIILSLSGITISHDLSNSLEKEISSKLIITFDDQGIQIKPGQRKVVVYCENQSEYIVSGRIDIDFFSADSKELTELLSYMRINELEPHAKSWDILWLTSIEPIATSNYKISNITYSKEEMPSGEEIAINIPALAKMSREQIIGLFGPPEEFEDLEGIDLSFQVNKQNIKEISVYYLGSQLQDFFITFKPPIDGYRAALEKLGLTSTIPPDINAPALYRWEERTKLDGFYSVQAVKDSNKKIESVIVVLNKIDY